MLSKVKQLFRDEQQFRFFGLLCLTTLFNFALIGQLLHYLQFDFTEIQSTQDLIKLRGTTTFFFLIWNLFLAWIPYWISLTLDSFYKWSESKTLIGILLFAWLLFFPNAPYIITDLLHLRNRAPIPHWYDLMLFLSFAWTGLILGLISLYEVHRFLNQHVSKFVSWCCIVFAIGLSGLGVYIGRVLRWNSWDILTTPMDLFHDLFYIIINPSAFPESDMIWVIGAFMFLAYLTFINFTPSDFSKRQSI